MKYTIGTTEGEFEPNSNNTVLKNKLCITTTEEMNEAETILLLKLYERIFEKEFNIEQLYFATIQSWHRQWLKPIYEWGGELRTVDLSKDGFRFAAAQFLEIQSSNFEKEFLSQYQNLNNLPHEHLVSFLAKSHVEFILIHPFREGNGRISRLLIDVMATQAGYHPLDYSLWDKHRDFYFRAIQAGVSGDYQHIERLIRDILPNQLLSE